MTRRPFQAPLDADRCIAGRKPLKDGSGARCMHRRKPGSEYCAQHDRASQDAANPKEKEHT